MRIEPAFKHRKMILIGDCCYFGNMPSPIRNPAQSQEDISYSLRLLLDIMIERFEEQLFRVVMGFPAQQLVDESDLEALVSLSEQLL